jgi:hypothetical protein
VREVLGKEATLEGLSRRYGFRGAVLSHSTLDSGALVSRLADSPNWRLVFFDRTSAIYLRDEEEISDPPQVDLDLRYAELAAEPLDRSPLPSWVLPRQRLYPGLNLAHFLHAAGRPDLAMDEVLRHWTASPPPELAVLGATAAEGSGQLDTWVPRLEESYRATPRSPRVRSWLARALYVRAVKRMAAEESSSAEADLLRASRMAPAEPGPYLALARLAAGRGEVSRAREMLEEALERERDGGVRRAAEEDSLLRSLLP